MRTCNYKYGVATGRYNADNATKYNKSVLTFKMSDICRHTKKNVIIFRNMHKSFLVQINMFSSNVTLEASYILHNIYSKCTSNFNYPSTKLTDQSLFVQAVMLIGWWDNSQYLKWPNIGQYIGLTNISVYQYFNPRLHQKDCDKFIVKHFLYIEIKNFITFYYRTTQSCSQVRSNSPRFTHL